jgi:hypothetical protein
MEAERDGWERSAEALIAQRNKPGSGATPSEVRSSLFSIYPQHNISSIFQELERKCSTLESDNRILKDRVSSHNSRLMSLV